jgi:hypothetical protein
MAFYHEIDGKKHEVVEIDYHFTKLYMCYLCKNFFRKEEIDVGFVDNLEWRIQW